MLVTQLLVAVLGAVASTASPIWSYAVSTKNGVITGHAAPNVSSVVEYLGIPYAQPPLGTLRFKPPKPYKSGRPFNAATWTPSKPVTFPAFTAQAQRVINYFAAASGNTQSEDCLALNVWTTSVEPRARKPVLIFFHGGRFSIGNTNSPFYDGQRLATSTGAVVVTLTYRLNIFGFPGAPGMTQNLGLRDQRLATEWIRDNIAGFGGDPKKLTIFGQSSGGVAADWWTFAYQRDPIVHGIISESGNAFSFPLNTPARTESNWYNISTALGCGSSGDTVACMQRQNWTSILAAASKLPAAPGGNPARSTPAFYPSVDNVTVFSNYSALLQSGNFAKIPQLLGNNDHEQGYYVIPAYARGISVTDAQADVFLLQSFTCPVSFEASIRRQQGVPVWVYRYFGDWENTRLYPTSGAYHGTELEMVFGNSEAVSGIPPLEDQEKLTALMQGAWVAFAADPRRGLSKLGWPLYDRERRSVVVLGYGNFVSPSVFDAQCSNQTLGVYG